MGYSSSATVWVERRPSRLCLHINVSEESQDMSIEAASLADETGASFCSSGWFGLAPGRESTTSFSIGGGGTGSIAQ